MPRFNFDTLSFLFGVVVASVFWWVTTLIRPLFRQMLEGARENARLRDLEKSSDLETSYRKVVYRQTQGSHLAASLFALDELVIEPRLLAPPAYAEPNTPRPHIDITEEAIPYMPADPEIAAVYGIQTLSLAEALTGGSNIVITGQPGTGKTIALAHLASQIVNRRQAVSDLHDFIPFFIHVADLSLPLVNPQKPEDFLAPITSKLAETKGMDLAKLKGFVEYAFHNGRGLLLLDGVDELPQTSMQEVTAYLRVILRQFPRTRIVTTGIPEYVDGLLSLGFAPLALMPWSTQHQAEFLEKWSGLWHKYVEVEAWSQVNSSIDALILNRWLQAENNFGLTPLEFTLKIWAAYAGDARGARPVDGIESHLRRMIPLGTPMEALYVVGTQASLGGSTLFDSTRAKEWTKPFETVSHTAAGTYSAEAAPAQGMPVEAGTGSGASETPTGPKSGQRKGTTGPLQQPVNLVQQLTLSGILAAHGGSRMRFSHPIYLGYLAGKSLGSSNAETILGQPTWIGQTTALRYMAAFSSDMSGIINKLLSMEDAVLLRPRLTAARMLRYAPKNAPWRGAVMNTLIQILQNEDLPSGLRGQAMAAFALSGDPNTGALFRQLMVIPSNEVRRLAAIGAGVVRDAKAVDALVNVISSSTGAARQAACLALVEIGTQPALEAVATALLRGDEQLRIAAAEALANHPAEGHEALKEGITSEDILVRRAIVYGLARVNEPWADEMLGQVPTKDEQWVVRNAAVELLEARQQSDPHIPRRPTNPSDMPWLIEFAGKYGMGVTPGQPATDLYLMALKDDNYEFRQAALHYLRHTPTEGVLSALYPHLYGTDDEMKEGVFQVLSEIAMSGINLPHPRQFGLG